MDFKENWNPELGLWKKPGPGHTAGSNSCEVIHPAPDAANRLLMAAQLDILDQIDVGAVLGALLDLVWLQDDDRKNCLRWHVEDDMVYDTNASFFAGISLIVLHKKFLDKLEPDHQDLLVQILKHLDAWFTKVVPKPEQYYPNKYLGDLVCKWLLGEIFDTLDQPQDLEDIMHGSAFYWRTMGWGWGEDMSDLYGRVLLNEISVLLLVSDRFPEHLRIDYLALADDLLEIEDQFEGGPRVPALRSYAFEAPKSHVNFRDTVRPWDGKPIEFYGFPDLGDLFFKLGWHDLMPKRYEPSGHYASFVGGDKEVGSAFASACIREDIRLGSISHFPVISWAEHPTWGLSWQCFPVAFSRGETDWGFWQWEVEEKGEVRAHPGNGGPLGLIPKALSGDHKPSLFGETHCLQRDGHVLMVRIMRRTHPDWARLTDRVKLCGGTDYLIPMPWEGRTELTLKYENSRVAINHFPLIGPEHAISFDNEELEMQHWSVNYDLSGYDPDLPIVDVWGVSLDKVFVHQPEIEAKPDGSFHIEWSWTELDGEGEQNWWFTVDPKAAHPLNEDGIEDLL